VVETPVLVPNCQGHHARASNSPATTAYIEAYDAGGTALGYLYKVDSNFYGITTAVSDTKFIPDPLPESGPCSSPPRIGSANDVTFPLTRRHPLS
jgi:hypothetical protein